jgi:uncharacterized membrane protein
MKNPITTVWHFYLDGFRNMTLGRVLWLIILIKLFVMFFILRPFFFPNFLNTHAEDGNKAEYVTNELIDRAAP